MKNIVVKKISVLILLLMATNAVHLMGQPTVDLELSQNWKFRQVGKKYWLPANVPGTVHTDLLKNKIIEDPYYRLNEHYMQWIDKADWEYESEFDITQTFADKHHIDLICEGLDTYASVFINDSLVLQADNMFRTWKLPVRQYLKSGKNKMHIVFKSPISEGLELLEKNGYPLPASNDQSFNGDIGDKAVSIFTRKAGYHYGWDWGPRLVTSGIWRKVKLRAWDDASIENIHVVQNEISGKTAELSGIVSIKSNSANSAEVQIFVDDIQVKSSKIAMKNGINEFSLSFEIDKPQLWWTNGLGSQKLYHVVFKVFAENKLIAEHSEKIGIRSLKLIRNPDQDGAGESFYFELNGVSIFAKGANYIPNDLFLPRVTPEKYESIVKAAADANMNMLRVWGGGVYEDDLFYDLCDQYGILVWQDFMFACSMYPGGNDFFDNVRNEAIDNVVRLRNHPCMALWCGNNEIETAWAEYNEKSGWGWKEQYTAAQRKEIWADYDTVFHQILPDVVKKYADGTGYWHSSPSAGMGKLATYTTTSGDMHYWGVWHGQHPFTDFRKYKARFMSEYGFQSFPEFQSVEKYTVPDDWNIESEVMASHQRSGIGNLRIRQYMEDDYFVPDDFRQFLYVGQLLQAQAITTAIEAHRSDMPYCMGSLYWQINDCWPVASWSGIDYYGRWKALHYAVKEAFKNDIVVVDDAEDKIRIRVISDRLAGYKARLVIKLSDFAGNVVWQTDKEIQVAPNSSEKYDEINTVTLLENFDRSKHFLLVELSENDIVIDQNIHYFVKSKYLKLSDPGLKMNVVEKEDLFEIRITGTGLIKNLYITSSATDSQFSDNYFDVLPGETKIVTITKKDLVLDKFTKSLEALNLWQTLK